MSRRREFAILLPRVGTIQFDLSRVQLARSDLICGSARSELITGSAQRSAYRRLGFNSSGSVFLCSVV
jgi:hypothetical protein